MHDKSLVSLVNDAAQLEKALIESGGELTPEIEKLLDVTELLPEKIDAYALIMDRMDSIEGFYAKKSLFYARLAKSAERVKDRCSENLKVGMSQLGVHEIKGFDVRFIMADTQSVKVEDEALIDGLYKTTELVTKIDKVKIKADLKMGVPVPGARLQINKQLRVYPNTPQKRIKKSE